MTTPAEVRFELQRKLLSLAQNGMVPLIMGIHSVVVEGKEVSVIHDVVPDACGNGLLFEFELPALVSRDELADFSRWLAWSGRGETLH